MLDESLPMARDDKQPGMAALAPIAIVWPELCAGASFRLQLQYSTHTGFKYKC